MCGVAAWLSNPNADEDEIMRRIAHRGTRSSIVSTRNGYVCHARLPIVGLGEEHDQPIRSSPWTMGFVGEILDFRETHPHLDSDVPLAKELWDQGPHAFKGRDGFWSIAAINANTNTVHAFCDYLGQKPMYYRIDFPSAASEPSALLPMGPTSWDEVYLSAVRKWGYCPDLTRTPWAEVKHVRPGEHVTIWANGYHVQRIVDPVVPVAMSEASLRTEIEKAVARRVLSSDVPVGALVSGGLDSSIVYSLAQQHGRVTAYHTRSSNSDTLLDREEEQRAKNLVLLPSEFKVVETEWEERENFLEAVSIMQEPLDLGSLMPQYQLSKAVSTQVCLTGDGADELFGGYSRSLRYDSQGSDVFQELPAWHLPRLDRIMMSRRIEVRSPFLARWVLEGALALPWERRKDKIALREMFKGWLPAEYLEAPKVPMKRVEVERNPDEYRELLISTFKELFPL